VPLAGGRLTAGVVRCGDTVRRPSGAASAATEALLVALERRGFAGAPRFLGRDDRGRDVLSWVPGDVVPRWRRFPDDAVHAAGALLRAFHDATDGVVCHGDPGPHNAIFRDGQPVVWIDFDLAGPGDPLADVAYAAWSWCLSSKPERGPLEAQVAQVRALCDGYRLPDRQRLVDAILARLDVNVAFWAARVDDPRADEIVAWTRRERAFVLAGRAAFHALG
jgi:aminoglycoside phosphotransferase (APT) family kinase protein